MAHADMVFAIELLALTSGMMLLVKACKEDVCCKGSVKIVAYFVIVASLLLMINTGLQCAKGCSRSGCPMMRDGNMPAPKMMHDHKMHKMMKAKPMAPALPNAEVDDDDDKDDHH